MSNSYLRFKQECESEIRAQGRNRSLRRLTRDWMRAVTPLRYSYHFEWQGRPIIQFPQDIVAMQELIWRIRPDLIIETGIAHGGSLVFNASMLALLDLQDAVESGDTIDPTVSRRKVLGIDIEIREHNRKAIEAHPMVSRIEMIEGSSTDPNVIDRVRQTSSDFEKVLVFLDSNHTHHHVLAELEAYAGLVTVGSYCVVFDTVIEEMPRGMYPDRPWGPGNNPKTAVLEFLELNPNFEVDECIEQKLLVTVAPHGYLRRLSS